MPDIDETAAAAPVLAAEVPQAVSKLAFIHIPKTAGTSFTRALAIGWPRVRIVGTSEAFRDITKEEAGALDLVAGHFFGHQMNVPKWAGFSGLTVLRDPRAKLMSSYRYARSMVRVHGVAGTPQMRFAARASFAEYAFSIYGVRDRHSQIYNLGSIPGENPHDVPLEELLARAKARIEAIEVGTADRLQDFVDHLFRRFGKGPAPTLERLNTAEERDDDADLSLTSWQDMALRELMRPDEDLVAHARALFKARSEGGAPGAAGLPAPIVATGPDAAEPPAPPRMLVGTFHQSGTRMMLAILRDVAAQLGYRLWVPGRTPAPEAWDMMFHAHSVFPPEILGQPHRGVIVMRDPRDIIISGALHHASQDADDDPWLYEPDPAFGGRSYHDVIAALPTDAERFLFEMDNFGMATMRNMRRQLEPSHEIIHVRFEDLVADGGLNEFRRIFAWLGLREADMDKALEIAAPSIQAHGATVAAQQAGAGGPLWREHFTPELHAAFHERFGDIAAQLGYPAA